MGLDKERPNKESVNKSGLSGLNVKLWVPTAEDVLQIVVKDFSHVCNNKCPAASTASAAF